MESFFPSLKRERAASKARAGVFDYIESSVNNG
jgi:hypothetical protein